jgi:hypothetical protein
VTRRVGRRPPLSSPSSAPSTIGRVAISGLLLVLAASWLVAPAGAAPTATANATTADARPRVRLLAQTPWVGITGTFTMQLGLPGAPPGSSISVRLYDDVSKGGRLHYLDTLRGDNLGNPLHAPFNVPIANLPIDDAGAVTASYEIATDRQPFIGFELRQSGVYPLVVSLVAPGGRELDSFHTAIIRLPEAANNESAPLAVAVIAPLDGQVALRTDNTDNLDEDTAAGIDDTVASLAAHPSVPLTVAPKPETIAALGRRDKRNGTDTIGQLRGALDQRQVLGEPYVTLDTGALTAAGMTDDLLQQLNNGTDSLADELGTRPDRRTWLVDNTTSPAALAKLRELGVDQVVVPEQQLAPLDAKVFDRALTRSFELDVAGQRTRAVVSDATLRFHVGATDDPVLNANQLVADLAVLSFDQPAFKRGAVLTLPDYGDTPKPFLDALLDALGDQPSADTGVKTIMSPVTLDGLFSFVEPAGQNGGRGAGAGVARPEPTLVRPWTSQPPASLGSYPNQLQLARNSVAGYQSMLGDLPDRDQRLASLERLLEVSADSGLDPGRRQQYLDAVVAFVNGQADAVSIPEQPRVTLTSSEGEVPVEVDNNLDYPVHVQLSLSSDKIDFLDRSTFPATLQPGSNRISIPVRTKSSGLFPVTVTATSPDGGLPMSSNKLSVRSTAISGLGLVLTIAAGLFLALWWARNFRTRRRSKRLVTDPTDLADAGDETITLPGAEAAAAAGATARGSETPTATVRPDPSATRSGS